MRSFSTGGPGFAFTMGGSPMGGDARAHTDTRTHTLAHTHTHTHTNTNAHTDALRAHKLARTGMGGFGGLFEQLHRAQSRAQVRCNAA